MRRLLRPVAFTGVVLLLISAALVSLGVASTRKSFPQTSGTLTLAGLTGRVDVLRDAYGVAQIYADNSEDLFEAEGFVHAQDRFYEMDFRRHLGAGRLSELYGVDQVETDTYLRTLGWRRVAEQEVALLAPSTRRYLDAYASGVNAYLNGRSAGDLSLEYTLLALQGLDYEPEPWTAADSLAWLKVMSWQLGANVEDEAERALVTAKLGASRAAALYPSYPLAGFDPIVTRGTVVGKAFNPRARRANAAPLPAAAESATTGIDAERAATALRGASRLGAVLPPAIGGLSGATGSNSWVVAGSRTESGHAILSNDPHLATSIPSVFEQIGLHCRSVGPSCPFDVSGFSMSSLPGVVIGRNDTISWGLTTSYVDAEDLYLEDVAGDTVRDGQTFVPLTVRTEQLAVRGEDQPRTVRIRSTRHGPLVSDVDAQLRAAAGGATPAGREPYGAALNWVALTPGRTMDGLIGINQARDFDAFREAAALISAPSQNLVYADTAGNIGYQLAGAVPLRNRGGGAVPAPGWDRRWDWKGTVPPAELPFASNPPSGFIVAANQEVIGSQYPYPVGSSYSYGWRSQQLVDRLERSGRLTLDDAESMFYDEGLRVAADVVPALLRIPVADPWVQEGQRTLVGWNYTAPVDSGPGAYFHVVLHDILKLTFRDELPEDLWPDGGDRWYAVVAALMDQPRSAWWDDVTTPQRETRDDILLAAMTNARKEATSLMSRDTSGWRWGTVHTVTLQNQTLGRSGVAAVERLFNRGSYPVGGGPAVVNAMAYDDRVGYAVTHAPTMRMLVDLGSPDASRWVNQSGTSGHAFQRNYDDQLPLWAGNRTWPFVSSRAAVEARTESRLALVPAN